MTTTTVLTASRCTNLRETNTPVDVCSIPAACAARADTLVVRLPGAYDKPGDFVGQSFVYALRAASASTR